jgi:hypothetical protein
LEQRTFVPTLGKAYRFYRSNRAKERELREKSPGKQAIVGVHIVNVGDRMMILMNSKRGWNAVRGTMQLTDYASKTGPGSYTIEACGAHGRDKTLAACGVSLDSRNEKEYGIHRSCS